MASSTLVVSLKAPSIPYDLIAQAAFANIETSFLDTAENNIVLSLDGKVIADQNEIGTLLANKANAGEGGSSVSSTKWSDS